VRVGDVREKVEVVRRVNEAFAARDIDALLALHHPDVEIIRAGCMSTPASAEAKKQQPGNVSTST
jgi:ketosteroid isomerase-like protein